MVGVGFELGFGLGFASGLARLQLGLVVDGRGELAAQRAALCLQPRRAHVTLLVYAREHRFGLVVQRGGATWSGLGLRIGLGLEIRLGLGLGMGLG